MLNTVLKNQIQLDDKMDRILEKLEKIEKKITEDAELEPIALESEDTG